ncbi:hypothetical protein SCHPADRAFT_672580 [Schizopora paradoxa]|uniref:Uncharacterized protein n=1 Tax=Schizopora paradoxa TaxID=27342 RepID=A0A0H2RBR5_9AGAM|nr:hypothetical protein SCHPADRAFT_672580 [Schizopora paradoxa]
MSFLRRLTRTAAPRSETRLPKSMSELYNTIPNDDESYTLPRFSPGADTYLLNNIRYSENNCTVLRCDRNYAAGTNACTSFKIPSPSAEGVRTIVWDLLRHGFARPATAPVYQPSNPVQMQLLQDFDNYDPRMYREAYIEVNALVVDSSFSRVTGFDFISSTITIRFNQKIRTYLVLSKYPQACGYTLFRLLMGM